MFFPENRRGRRITHTVASIAIVVGVAGCASNAPENTPEQGDYRQNIEKLAASLKEQGDTAAVAGMYQNAVERYPHDQRLELQLGNALLADKQYAQAEKVFRDILGSDIEQPDALLGLGSAQLFSGNPELASANLERASQRLNTHTVWVRLGVARAMLGHMDDAVNAFQRDVKLAPNSPDRQTNLAIALALAERSQPAQQLMQKVCDSPLAEQRHFKARILVDVLAGDEHKAASDLLPNASSDERNQLIARARQIASLPTGAQQVKELGILKAAR
ncbi:tetratricopeptide repeat protein [Carnimonas bestiolae]|uniref:tetratricopeptide repeat protein n=1 Tax=Carnimonas bestiolae TaxID=3402172 RepID=UPI003EDC3899